MEWQYGHPNKPCSYNWIIARGSAGILGILGYIPTSRFDPGSTLDPVLWLALWKVRDDAGFSGLGLRLLMALSSQEPHRAIGALGLNPKLPPMYRALGYTTGELNQHVIFNPALPPRISKVPENFPLPRPSKGDAALIELNETECSRLGDAPWDRSGWQNRTYKTPAYFMNRYCRHPLYRYHLYRIISNDRPRGLIAARIAQAPGGRVLRIVDFTGEQGILSRCGDSIQRILAQQGLEYADLWEYGLDAQSLTDAGFHRVERDGPLIVPNYFEPFERVGARIEFAVKGFNSLDYAIMRGDGDQDRPNRIAS
jgi:hypothetical protein